MELEDDVQSADEVLAFLTKHGDPTLTEAIGVHLHGDDWQAFVALNAERALFYVFTTDAFIESRSMEDEGNAWFAYWAHGEPVDDFRAHTASTRVVLDVIDQLITTGTLEVPKGWAVSPRP